MTLILILGVLLWIATHVFKRLFPEVRANLGDPGKGIITAAIVASVVMMVVGYRGADGAVFWGRSGAGVGINNLLMILAVYTFGASAAKGAKVWLGTKLRHPQLMSVVIWSVGHLIVNGDVPSFILFGGLLAWSLGSMVLINRDEGPWTVPERAPVKKEVTLVIVTIVMLIVISTLHILAGASPFGG